MTGAFVFLLWVAVPAALVLVWLLFRSGGYKRKPLDRPPGGDFAFTGERFLDPSSGVMIEVWMNARSGQRAYVRARSGRSDAAFR